MGHFTRMELHNENSDPQERDSASFPRRGKRRPPSSASQCTRRNAGPKRRRRPGPASRALKAFYQKQKLEESIKDRNIRKQHSVHLTTRRISTASASASASASATSLSSSMATSTSKGTTSYEHKYSDNDDSWDVNGIDSSNHVPNFEFKSQDYEDLVTPRVHQNDAETYSSNPSRLSKRVNISDYEAPTSLCIAPKKRMSKGPSDEFDFYANVPDTSRIDLSSN